jgi:hypothetical protein
MSKTLRGTNGQVIFLKTARKILNQKGWKQHKKTLLWSHPINPAPHTINQAWAIYQAEQEKNHE